MIPLLVQPISNKESTNILPVPWIRFSRCRFHGIDRLVMVQSTIGRVLTDMEREIEVEVRNRPPVHEPGPVNLAPPGVGAPALAMPDYVEHRDGATEIGKLTAEAIVREYEAAAKDIEAMGAELI